MQLRQRFRSPAPYNLVDIQAGQDRGLDGRSVRMEGKVQPVSLMTAQADSAVESSPVVCE